MKQEKKQKFLKLYRPFADKNLDLKLDMEECQNGYNFYTQDFQSLVTILNFLGAIAAQFNMNYGYDEGHERMEDYDYQVTVIDFDENWAQRSEQYI